MSEQHNKPIIGITLGDYNGIGPEVILKALHGNHLNKHFTPVIYGSMRVLNRYKHLYDMKDWQLHGATSVTNLNPKMVNVITCFDDSQTNVDPGKALTEAGQAAYACLANAVEDLKGGHLAALVTAPINKHTIQSETFKFPGHTEYLAEAFESREHLMFMVSERLKIGVVTGHIPLGRIRSQINQDLVTRKLSMLVKSLQQDFGINKPRVAVLGLNPHAGEDGLLGTEEKEIIMPVIEQFRKKNHLVYGPFPADGFFGAASWKKFDGILALYHDQGLMPFKMLAFEDGVNFTAGIPIVRTSPDHGTAYDIAGKNVADPSSMLQAIYTAIDVAKNRAEWNALQADRLNQDAIQASLEDKPLNTIEEKILTEIKLEEPKPAAENKEVPERSQRDARSSRENQTERPNRREDRQPYQRHENNPKHEERAPQENNKPESEEPRGTRPERPQRQDNRPQGDSKQNKQPRDYNKPRPQYTKPEIRPVPPLSPELLDIKEAQLGLLAISQEVTVTQTPPNPEEPEAK
ncbi:MAG: 4-hydroxythreonine-4-phosphate dehydrogenase PdxA [Siphonobacter sp.]